MSFWIFASNIFGLSIISLDNGKVIHVVQQTLFSHLAAMQQAAKFNIKDKIDKRLNITVINSCRMKGGVYIIYSVYYSAAVKLARRRYCI